MNKQIVIEHLGHSAIVTIDNPPANAWTLESLQALASAMELLGSEQQVNAVVLTGAGEKFFSAGADLQQFAAGDETLAAQVADAFALAFNSIRHFHGVTVAAVNGYALGGGLECALACDYIVAERGARLGLPEASVGLIPCAGGTKALADRVGVAWAKRIILGGETVDADLALRIGVVEEVVDAGLAKIMAVSLAGKVSRQSRSAVLAARRLIDGSPQSTLDRQLLLEKAAFLELMGGAEQLEGVRAFLEKRQPSWLADDDD
ncbi:enoyl-CoA hydratase [Vogesella oryzae]|uniref:enoyl-CoA hydratase n=1 Tax=Vogesella oryzae TaxID=1735285 RepID=UPI00158409C8|nr:enoyl-CoA hydratase [Vogesella oryzae]